MVYIPVISWHITSDCVPQLQTLWQQHTTKAAALFSVSMWRILHAVKLESKHTQTNVLKAVLPMLSKSDATGWPVSRRRIDDVLKRKVGDFHSRVLRTIHVDLRHHGLPGVDTPVKFTFIDPVYAWVVCACNLARTEELIFSYKPLYDDAGHRLYGGSVMHGDIMRKACGTLHYGSPALFGLSLDAGNATKRRSYTPIVLSVGNTDYAGSKSCTCIGYLPILDLGNTNPKPKDLEAAKHELLQRCMRAIMLVIEDTGMRGFKCKLPEKTQDGKYTERMLFPFLTRMEIDTKERTKFFCLAREHACGIGSGPRQGHSNFRTCTPHSTRDDTGHKKHTATRDGEDCAAARSLKRRGIHPMRRCRALSQLKHCVLHWPHRVYYGLFNYDVMHVLFLNCIGYLLDATLALLPKSKKLELDRRARELPSFRNPYTGKTTRKVTTLSTTAYLTAEMKVVHLFLWSHVLGSKALLIPAQELRHHILLAFTNLQMICYSVRGLRPYTEAEHNYIFKQLGLNFWRALTKITHYTRQNKINDAVKYNDGKPPEKRHRVPYYKAPQKLSDESDDTASSSDSDVEPYYFRSAKIIPHAFVHFPDQVCMGGSHKFHDTSPPESSHKRNLSFAASRARTYHNKNRSTDNMLHFTLELRLIEGICRQAGIVIDEEDNDNRADHDEPGLKFVHVRLSNIIQSDSNGLVTLYRGSRGVVAASRKFHSNTLDTVLHEGVPLSVRELVSLVAEQLQLPQPDQVDTIHKLLLCSWKLGWHVTGCTDTGDKSDFWGGGVTPNTTNHLLRGDWIEISGMSSWCMSVRCVCTVCPHGMYPCRMSVRCVCTVCPHGMHPCRMSVRCVCMTYNDHDRRHGRMPRHGDKPSGTSDMWCTSHEYQQDIR